MPGSTFQRGTLWSQPLKCYPDDLLIFLQLEAEYQAGWRELLFYMLFQGLPGKTEERTRKHRLSSPSLLLSLSSESPLGNCQQNPTIPKTSLGCLDRRMGPSVFQGLVCLNVYTNYVRVGDTPGNPEPSLDACYLH